MCNLLLQSIRRYQRRKISVHWEQRKLSLTAKYLDVTLNFLYVWEKANEWKQLRDEYPFQLVWESTTFEQTHLDFVNQHRFHIRKEQILLFKNWFYRNEIQSATKFHRTLTLLTAKIFSTELAVVVWRTEGFRGWQFNRYKPIFILQLIRAVELALFTMKDRNLNFLAADNN